jgi:hypothetical protein
VSDQHCYDPATGKLKNKTIIATVQMFTYQHRCDDSSYRASQSHAIQGYRTFELTGS